jgi:hypothetical protein
MNATVLFAFDRSARYYDADGRLHVRVSNISKATVNPYRGDEIPGFQDLGLDPSRVYYMLRDPDELAKGAASFNNLQILSRHVPVNAKKPMKDLTIGSLGTDADFSNPYLRNSLCFWDAEAIAAIESREVVELSAAYRYSPDMTPGTYEGLHYDGVMRSILGNHVALVESGRAGSDVVVADSQIEGPIPMKTKTALLAAGALRALVGPKLAMDKAFDPSPILAGLSRKNLKAETQALAAKVVRTATPLLAQDESLDVDDVVKVIGALNGAVPADESDDLPEPEDTPAVDDGDEDPVAKLLAFLKGKLGDEDFAAASDMVKPKGAKDGGEEPPKPGEGEPKPKDEKNKDDRPAMDAATIERNTIARLNAIRDAERDVFPVVGEIKVAMDSAAAVYKFALEQRGVDLNGVEPSAYRGLFKALPTGDAPKPRRETIAMDGKGDDFRERFPTAGRLKRGL